MDAPVCKEDLVDRVSRLPVSKKPLLGLISKEIASFVDAIVTHIQIEDGLEGRLSGEDYQKIHQTQHSNEKAKTLLAVVWKNGGDTLLRFLYAIYAVCPCVLDKIQPGLEDNVGEVIVDEMTKSGQFLDRCRPLRERLNTALKNLPKSRLKLLVVGNTGVGKSALVNSLLGKAVAKESPSTRRGTSLVKRYEDELNEMKVQVWDTPGLWDFELEDITEEGFETDRSAEYLVEMQRIGRVDLILFCVDAAAGGNISFEDGHTIELLTRVFGNDTWNHAIIVLTKANMLRSADDTDDGQKLTSVVKDMTNQYRKLLVKRGQLSEEVAASVPCLPAGSSRDLLLADGRPWLPEIWVTAAEKTRHGGGQAVLIEWNRTRVKARQEDGDDSIEVDDKMIELSREQVRRIAKVIRNVQSDFWTKFSKFLFVGAGSIVGGLTATFTAGTLAAGGLGAGVGAVLCGAYLWFKGGRS